MKKLRKVGKVAFCILGAIEFAFVAFLIVNANWPRVVSFQDFSGAEKSIKTTDASAKAWTSDEKGFLMLSNGTKILVGYGQEPVVLDSSGTWRDADGDKVPKKLVRKIFREVPDYGRTVIRFNDLVADQMTSPERWRVLDRFRELAGADDYYLVNASEWNTVQAQTAEFDEFYGSSSLYRRFEKVWKLMKKSGALLAMLSPSNLESYDLCNQILKNRPESVPIIYHDGCWWDQNAEEMSDRAAEKWLTRHPECAEYTERLQELDDKYGLLMPVTILAFREDYVAHCQQVLSDTGELRIDEDDYSWWCDSMKVLLEGQSQWDVEVRSVLTSIV